MVVGWSGRGQPEGRIDPWTRPKALRSPGNGLQMPSKLSPDTLPSCKRGLLRILRPRERERESESESEIERPLMSHPEDRHANELVVFNILSKTQIQLTDY